MIRPQN